MTTECRITEVFKVKECHNPISGHRWSEAGPTTGWKVTSPLGLKIKTCKSLAAAERVKADWDAFYAKFPAVTSHLSH